MKIKILFLLFPIFIFAQKQKIQLLDKATKEPLQFVELLYNNKTIFSDKNGTIFIDFNENKIDILDGNYEPNVIEISTNTNIIELQNTVTQLQEIVISKKPRIIINPQSKGLWDHTYIGMDMVLLNEITFNKEYQDKYLRKVTFKSYRSIPANFDTSVKNKDFKKSRKKQMNATQLLRLNIFNENKEIIYSSIPVEYNTTQKHSFEIDILEDILITDKPVYIEIQVIGYLDETGTFKEYYSSIRPQQAKNAPKEYKIKILQKKRTNNNSFYVDIFKLPYQQKFYINFGFEFEDVE